MMFSLRAFLVFATLGTACAPHFRIPTASDFGVLEESHPYDFRAVTPEGVVMAVRELHYDKQQGQLAFWIKAIKSEVLHARGYALLEEKSVRTRRGLTGTQLRFGMDREGEPNEYVVTVFAIERRKKMRLYVLEAGGSQSLLQAHRAQIDWSISEFVAR